jgi:hypothetical protein
MNMGLKGAIDGNFYRGIYIQSDGRIAGRGGTAEDFGYESSIKNSNTGEFAKKGSMITTYYQKERDIWSSTLDFMDEYGKFKHGDSSYNLPSRWIESEGRWEDIP